MPRTLYELPAAAITKHHKPRGCARHTFIVSQLWRSEVGAGAVSEDGAPSESSQRVLREFSEPFPPPAASGGPRSSVVLLGL